MTQTYEPVVETARCYYNSSDADTFYYCIWGGEDIHIGIYEHDEEPIFDASRRTVATMASKLAPLDGDCKVLDLGAGYGGACRYLADKFGCSTVALNLSEEQNRRNREISAKKGLADLVDVVDGSFENIPYNDESFDVVWSQDAILHSARRKVVMEEIARVLKPGGSLVFTDPMMHDQCPTEVLTPILERIHLDTLGSPGFYRQAASEVGLKELGFEDHSSQLPRHYGRVLRETECREDELCSQVSMDYIQRMKKGLRHWVEGGHNKHLVWGIFHFEKPA